MGLYKQAKKLKEVSSMSEAVRVVLDRYPLNTEFSGREFMNEVARAYPQYRNSFGDTRLRRLRGNRKRNGYEILCINMPRSIYKKIACKGAK